MIRRLFHIFIVFSLLFISFNAEGQFSRGKTNALINNRFQIQGRVKLDKGDPSGVLVNLINLDSKLTEKSVTLPSTGKFDIDLSYFKEYKLSITKDGYYDAEINVSTVIPSDVWEKDSVFPPYLIVIPLNKKVEGTTLSFEGKVIGKISYSVNGRLDNFDTKIFIDDKTIREEIDNALKMIEDKDFNQKMAEALEYEKNSDLSNAYRLYNEAFKIKPSDKFVKEKIKELAIEVKNLGNDAKIKAEFERLIALGDANVASLKYNDAIQYYKGALKVMPNDPVAASKLAGAEKQLALIGDKAKKEAEFNRLIAAGDVNVSQLKYTEAITSFKAALVIKPGDLTATTRISDAEKLLANAAENAKKDAEFNRLIAAGDVNVGQLKYTEAITNFKAALDIKPGDTIALARISDAEKQLAAMGDKAKKEADFSRLIAEGDKNVKILKYTEAITSFKAALDIKPGDSATTARISDAEKLLALASEKAKKEAEFKRLIAEGDMNVGQLKYSEAITSFKSALGIKPGDSIALARILDAEKQLAAMGDKAKKDAEFNRLIAAGDVNVGLLKYSEAITNFKAALDIKPGDTIATARISDAEKQLALIGDKAKKDAEFSRLIAAGDVNVGQFKYTEAITSFKAALDIKPGDTIALARLSDAEKQLAAIGDKAKKDAEFNKLIAAGEVNVGQLKYMEAITSFKAALDIKPGDTIALARISDAEKQLALIGEKAKKDKEFDLLIAAGDNNVNKVRYEDAIKNFTDALTIKPDNSVAKEKLTAVELLLAKLLASNIKTEEEFKRLVLKGDDNVTGKIYSEAISSYKGALLIKPDNQEVVVKINNAVRLLALEKDAQNKLDQEFNRLLASGDASINVRKYTDALTFYTSASALINNEIVKTKIAEAQRLIQLAEAERIRIDAEKQAAALKQQQYKEAIEKADQLFASKSFQESKQLYLQALTFDQLAPYPSVKIREIDKIMAQLKADDLAREQESAKLKLYNDAIKIADKNFEEKSWNIALVNYTKASDIRINEAYPKTRILEIQKFIAMESTNAKLYNDAMIRGGAFLTAKHYSDAILAFKEAQKIKPAEILPPQKIKEIQSIIDGLAMVALENQKYAEDSKLSSTEKAFLEKIKIADDNYKKSQWSVARFYYIEALKIKQSDNYSLKQVDDCDKMIDSGITAEKMQEYKSKVNKADDEMKVKNYSSAKFYYRSASDILKWETYPVQQIKEIDKIIAEKLSQSDQRQFTENLNKGDQAFNNGEYPTARFYYNKAIEISPSDHVTSQLKEIESIVNGTDSKKINAAYDDFIKKGDEAVKQKNNSIARFYFQKASVLKPNENYPKEELKKINSGADNL